MTPLHWAANRGRKDVARLLVESGADINKADLSGKTPLHWASQWMSLPHNTAQGFCYGEVVQLLIDCGAVTGGGMKEFLTRDRGCKNYEM